MTVKKNEEEKNDAEGVAAVSQKAEQSDSTGVNLNELLANVEAQLANVESNMAKLSISMTTAEEQLERAMSTKSSIESRNRALTIEYNSLVSVKSVLEQILGTGT